MVKREEIKEVEVDDVMDGLINDVVNACAFTKEDYLFLVKCLNENYLEFKRKMKEIEDIYYSLKTEAQKRWYYATSTCCLALAVSRKHTELPF